MIYINFVRNKEKGILKKINFQKKALNKYIKVDLLENIDGIYYYKNKVLGKYPSENSFFDKIQRKIQELIILKKLLKVNENNIYMRYVFTSPFLLQFFKKMSIQKKKIIIEIPTYPYDDENQGNWIFKKMDRYYRKKLYKYIDRIVTYSEDEEIWGIPCINISNGIDLEEIKIIEREKKEENRIVFTSVSNCSFWHGIDRFLYSLEEYSKVKEKKEIFFNIVGEGDETRKLKGIVSKSEYLSKIVKFQGFKTGAELDKIYNQTDVAIGSLGRHRSGLNTMRALKNREYCAKGLPMVFSEKDPDLSKFSFVYNASPNEKLIDIKELIDWYSKISFSSNEIREVAKKFSWDIQMKKVIDELNKI